MVFSSILFLFRFLPIALILYFAAPGKLKNLVLFALSLCFYAWGEPVYVVLMLFSTVVDYVHGRIVEKLCENGQKNKAKFAVMSSVIINLGLLCFFKYSDFLILNLNSLLGLSLKAPNLPLPIGISFYTFQTMSYTIDVYRGEAKAQKNIISFGTYVALFPQLIAGPIVRYKTVAEQMEHRNHSFEKFSYGVVRFVTGLGKKVLLANNIGLLWEEVSHYNGQASVLYFWLGILAFSFQIYFDFSGYSDMAIGLGAIFGFEFDENFRYPYESASITEFWRRWHISLGTWFREYVYIPLGGNRKGKSRQIANLLIVWALTGIWHGASWNFMAWGLYFGVILILEKTFLRKALERVPKVFRHLYAIVLIVIGWAIFAFDDFSNVVIYIGKMFGNGAVGLVDDRALYVCSSYGILILILIVACTEFPKKFAIALCRVCKNEVLFTILQNVFLIAVFLLSVAYIVDASYNPFLYFRF